MNPVFEEQAEHMNISVPTDSRYSAIHLLRYTHIYEKKNTNEIRQHPHNYIEETHKRIAKKRTKKI